MTSRARVERPSPAADRVRPAVLAAAAAVGLTAGLALVAATLSPDRSEAGDTPSEAAGGPAREPPPGTDGPKGHGADAGPKPTGAPSPALEETEPHAAREPTAPTQPTGSPTGDERPSAPDPDQPRGSPAASSRAHPDDPPPTTTEAPAGALRMVPGRVAYLQCEGVPLQDGPFPCPRDRALEKRVWDTLRGLPECPGAPDTSGKADIRLHFEASGSPGVSFLGRATDLDQGRLRSCLDEPLTALDTALDPEHMVVSFRFELTPAR